MQESPKKISWYFQQPCISYNTEHWKILIFIPQTTKIMKIATGCPWRVPLAMTSSCKIPFSMFRQTMLIAVSAGGVSKGLELSWCMSDHNMNTSIAASVDQLECFDWNREMKLCLRVLPASRWWRWWTPSGPKIWFGTGKGHDRSSSQTQNH